MPAETADLRPWNSVSALCGALSAALGAVVVAAWHAQNDTVLHILPGLTPMVYNSAICFAACGLALLSLNMGKARIAAPFAVVTAALSLASLTEDAAGISLGIDQLLITADDPALHPGRMAPNTAISFTAIAIALLLMRRLDWSSKRSTAIALSGSLPIALGFVSLAGYGSGIPTFAWGKFIPMALHTAAGLAALGVGLLASAWQRARSHERLPSWLYLVVTIAAAVMTFSVWQSVAAEQQANSGRGGSPMSQIALAAGLLLSLLLGAAVWFAQTAYQRTQTANRLMKGLEAEVAERRRAEQLLDQFFTLSLEMLCIAGTDGRFKRLNPAWTRTLGWPLDELMGRPFLDFVHPDDAPATRETVRRQQQGASITAFENRYRTSDGSYRWLRWNSMAAPDRDLIYAAARDVTGEKERIEALRRGRDELDERVRQRTAELQETNQALHQREELFRKLFEDSPFGAALVGLDHRLSRVNRALCDLLEFSAGELTGMTIEAITFPEDLQLGTQELNRLIQGETASYRITRRYVRKTGGVIWADVTTTSIRDESGGVLTALAIVEDVTGRRERQERISSLNRELQDRVGQLTALNEELEAFNSSISHDLRAPLRHLDAFSKILVDELGPSMPPEARRCADRIRGASCRMGRMVDELLELSRTSRRSLGKQLTPLRVLVDDAIAELQPEIQGRDLEWDIGALPSVECDPTLARQVFANLLSNAVKFSRDRHPAIVEVGYEEQAGVPVLFVRDNGVGFKMEYADKLFGVFQRLHRREDFEGTGIGLATVKRIVLKHGGRIWAQSQVDRGATFYFTLGRQESATENDSPLDHQLPPARSQESHEPTLA